MAGEYTFLKKAVAARSYLLKTGKGHKTSASVQKATVTLSNWIATKRNQNDAAARRIMLRHAALVEMIIPKQLNQQFQELCQNQPN